MKKPIITITSYPEFILGIIGLSLIASQNWIIALGVFFIQLKQSKD
jgi:hypothetical protein